MSAAQFASGVRDLLVNDAIFTARIAALIGIEVTTVFRGNVPVASLPADAMPCWVIEQGDGVAASLSNNASDEGMVIGCGEQQFASELLLSLVWVEDDRDRAFEQRAELPTLMAQLMLRNPMAGGIDFAMLTEWEPDKAVNHPLQIWRALLRGQYAIPQS